MPDQVFVGPDGGLIAIQEYGADARVFVARDISEAAHWELSATNGVAPSPSHPGFAISEEGIATLLAEVEAVPDPTTTGDPVEDAILLQVATDAPVYRLGLRGQRFINCARSFREFLKVWHFLDQDTGQDRLLGEVLWDGQETYVQMVMVNRWVYSLKNRQIGYTTIACAYDAWVLRFRSRNARVHLVSRTETLAKNSLLKPLKYGVKRLPEEMQLPVTTDTTTEFTLLAGEDDRRHAQAYPAKEPGRAETCSHLHLDEWAAMAETTPELPRDVWAAAEPTISKQGGSVHILCTGTGPIGYYADVWRRCVAGEGQLAASFIPATGARPEYTREFLVQKKQEMGDDTKFMHEYPERWEDALSGGTGLRFSSPVIDAASENAAPFQDQGTTYHDPLTGRARKRKYVKCWDIAGPSEHSDATVGIVLDITDGVWDVVHIVYNRSEDYPVTASRIRTLHAAFSGPTVIEDNEAGKAVRAFLNLPDDQVHGWNTTRYSKPTIITELGFILSQHRLKWDGTDPRFAKLDAEFRGYALPDDNIQQDCVMAVGIGIAWILSNPQLAHPSSRVMTELITHI